MPRKKASKRVRKVQVNFRLTPETKKMLDNLAKRWRAGDKAPRTVVITDLIEARYMA